VKTPTYSSKDKTRLKFDIGEVALAMIHNATNSTIECSQYSRLSMLHFLQLLVNKFGAAAEKVGDRTVAQVMVELIKGCEANSNETEVERCYQALAYFSAASVARSDPSCEDLIRLMVDGLKHPVVGRKVAQSFRILIGPSSIMSEANFCAIRPLRQGRLFSLAVENIKSLWREYSFEQQGHALANEIKTNCLIALAGSLAYMDRAVYLIHVSTVLPLLLEGTNVQNDEFTKLSCIEIIRKLVPLCPDVVRVHLDSVINRMTDRTHNTYYSPSDASAACRVAAIDVLARLPRYVDNADLIKRKTKIMAELDIALNDVSMDVRIRAQKCKMAYFNLES
jgi:DNA repair/transcription protein MET18/MMS19